MRVATSWAGTGMACLLFSLACASPGAAQSAASTPVDPGACQAFAKANAQGATVLHAVCGTSGLSIGQVDTYQAINVATSGAVLIDATLNGDRRLWLVSPDANGEPMLEELTGLVAYQAGRGGNRNLSGLGIDLSNLPTRGAIGLHVSAEKSGQAGRNLEIDLSEEISAAGRRQ